eukprot:m.472477 g.472477  ORF g.472477 m.472477 type:complete len:165 (-) comp57112_c0_seq4:4358-4852(-)
MEGVRLEGCRVPVLSTIDQETHARMAEILKVKIIDDKPQYYVHFIDFNKRLDEWVTEDRIDMTQLQQPKKEEKRASSGAAASKKARIRTASSVKGSLVSLGSSYRVFSLHAVVQPRPRSGKQMRLRTRRRSRRKNRRKPRLVLRLQQEAVCAIPPAMRTMLSRA